MLSSPVKIDALNAVLVHPISNESESSWLSSSELSPTITQIGQSDSAISNSIHVLAAQNLTSACKNEQVALSQNLTYASSSTPKEHLFTPNGLLVETANTPCEMTPDLSSVGTVTYNYRPTSNGFVEDFDVVGGSDFVNKNCNISNSFVTEVMKIPPSGSSKSRCSRVTLAGSSYERGLKASAFSKCACDNLRCIQCNFQVQCYRGARWNEEAVDYMFFRNNVPNDLKLSVNLVAAHESFAYCCQCSWIDTQSEIVLNPGSVSTIGTSSNKQPQWICGGH